MRLVGSLALLLSLLGWSAWWVVCNVYEFAPPLNTAALLCALAVAVLAALGQLLRMTWPAWLLAASNGLYLLAVHRQLDAGLGPPLFGLLLAALLCLLVWRRGKSKRPTSLPAVCCGCPPQGEPRRLTACARGNACP